MPSPTSSTRVPVSLFVTPIGASLPVNLTRGRRPCTRWSERRDDERRRRLNGGVEGGGAVARELRVTAAFRLQDEPPRVLQEVARALVEFLRLLRRLARRELDLRDREIELLRDRCGNRLAGARVAPAGIIDHATKRHARGERG